MGRELLLPQKKDATANAGPNRRSVLYLTSSSVSNHSKPLLQATKYLTWDNIAIPVHLTATLKILFNAGLINSPGSALSRKPNSSTSDVWRLTIPHSSFTIHDLPSHVSTLTSDVDLSPFSIHHSNWLFTIPVSVWRLTIPDSPFTIDYSPSRLSVWRLTLTSTIPHSPFTIDYSQSPVWRLTIPHSLLTITSPIPGDTW